jgi:hypothetical protein
MKRSLWEKHIDNWDKSGLSQRAYCDKQKLNLGTFTYWRKQLRRDEQQNSFVEIGKSQESTYFELKTKSGTTIRVPPNFNENELTRLLQVVQ